MSGDTDSMGERESVPARFSLFQLDDLEPAYGSRRLSEELRLTASDIWITLVAPGQVIALDGPEYECSVLLVYRGEIDIEWDDFSTGSKVAARSGRRWAGSRPAKKLRRRCARCSTGSDREVGRRRSRWPSSWTST